MPTKKEKQPLSVTHPELAKEADGWDATQFTLGSVRRLNWKCTLGHNWIATPNSRTSQNSGCPYCAGQKLLTGFNDLSTMNPSIAKEADGWDPSSTFFRFSKRLNWKCEYGHTWVVSPSNRYFSNSGCPVCAGKRVLPGFNDLKTLFPAIAAQAYNWNPEEVSPNSHKKYQWKCSCGYIWVSTPNRRLTLEKANRNKKQVSGCPNCAGKVIKSGVNDLETLFPEIAIEADGWDPSNSFPVSHQIRTWKCSQGHSWKASNSNRTSRKSKCPVCSGQKLLSGFNDLLTMYPDIARELRTEDPSKILAGTHRRVSWRCKEAHTWSATVDSRTHGGNGCPTCANSGFDPNEDGYLYFIEHQTWSMYQIGITNNPKRRINDHMKLGWVVREIRGPSDGHLVQQWETAILRMLKVKGADLSNANIAGKFTGYSEAWSKSTFEVKSIKELMRLTEEYESE